MFLFCAGRKFYPTFLQARRPRTQKQKIITILSTIFFPKHVVKKKLQKKIPKWQLFFLLTDFRFRYECHEYLSGYNPITLGDHGACKLTVARIIVPIPAAITRSIYCIVYCIHLEVAIARSRVLWNIRHTLRADGTEKRLSLRIEGC